MKSLLNQYSAQVLSFNLEGTEAPSPLQSYIAQKHCERHLNIVESSGKENIILFGLGDTELASLLARERHTQTRIIICELYPSRISSNMEKVTEILANADVHLICDSSLWAHLLLLEGEGFSADNSQLVLNPGLTGSERENLRNLQRLVSGISRTSLPKKSPDKSNEIQPPPSLTAAAILSPDEPELDKFIDSLPLWIDELAIVWDCPPSRQIPEIKTKILKKQVSRPLEGDFSAQRNLMLSLCEGDWIIYLDADELMSKQSWASVRNTISYAEIDAVYLPRKTFYPDEKHCRMGYGLWPDLQLRLFRNTPKLSFERPIHEKLGGFAKPAIFTGAEILHITHLLKSREDIDHKLSGFDRASGGKINHHFGRELPSLPCNLLPGPEILGDRLLRIPAGHGC